MNCESRRLSYEAWHVAVVLSPLVLLPAVAWIARSGARAIALTSIPVVLTAYFTYVWWVVATTGPFSVTIPWAPSLGLSLSFRFDGLSALFSVLITAVGALIVPYASTYLAAHPHGGRFFVTLFAFMGSMLGVVLSDNILSLFVFWELTGFTSYLLIGFDSVRAEARRAALQALLVTAGGGLALLAAGILLTQVSGTPRISEWLAAGDTFVTHRMYGVIAGLVLFAAFTKSAQFPFHFWLPNAMQAPTPVSAYLHSATMVKAGIYLVARLTPVLGGSVLWTGALVTAGTLTMLGGSYRAVRETDLKRILAYSTIAALGVMMLLLGIGTDRAVTAALVYLVAHACYKGALFLVAGAVEHGTGTRDVVALGGLRSVMPRTALAGSLAAVSMAGVPLSVGFLAKEQLYESLMAFGASGFVSGGLIAAALIASALLGAAGILAGASPFYGRSIGAAGAHEVGPAMWLGPLVLGFAGLAIGVMPAFLEAPLALAVTAVTQQPGPVTLSLWHGFTPTLALSGLTLAGSIGLFASRNEIRRIAWPRGFGTERLYTHALTWLDTISRGVAPALQSASLRSYALVVVLTSVVLVGAALAANRVLPMPSRWTPIQVHEGMLAALIVTAAVSATFARSNLAAVLSVGTVGYGVALLYALFGAPDLAMTQFAVETLTVVIFVLVFYQLRGGFGDLSGRLTKARDAIVSGAAGLLVTTLVLFIGASGTTSRLSEYFADAAPRLAHGRNVVNVILVDFRGFDTLGEITVLVTVAIGVGALLLMGRERRS
jgi:multicomponent Na+:H+ antiporter subunit A